MRIKIGILLFLTFFFVQAQKNDITTQLYESYEKYKEKSLDKRRIKHHQLQPLLTALNTNSSFTVKVVGKSIEGRDLSLVSIGKGKTNVFLWSQMHGDEPTATQAIFDIFNFFGSDEILIEMHYVFNLQRVKP